MSTTTTTTVQAPPGTEVSVVEDVEEDVPTIPDPNEPDDDESANYPNVQPSDEFQPSIGPPRRFLQAQSSSEYYLGFNETQRAHWRNSKQIHINMLMYYAFSSFSVIAELIVLIMVVIRLSQDSATLSWDAWAIVRFTMPLFYFPIIFVGIVCMFNNTLIGLRIWFLIITIAALVIVFVFAIIVLLQDLAFTATSSIIVNPDASGMTDSIFTVYITFIFLVIVSGCVCCALGSAIYRGAAKFLTDVGVLSPAAYSAIYGNMYTAGGVTNYNVPSLDQSMLQPSAVASQLSLDDPDVVDKQVMLGPNLVSAQLPTELIGAQLYPTDDNRRSTIQREYERISQEMAAKPARSRSEHHRTRQKTAKWLLGPYVINMSTFMRRRHDQVYISEDLETYNLHRALISSAFQVATGQTMQEYLEGTKKDR